MSCGCVGCSFKLSVRYVNEQIRRGRSVYFLKPRPGGYHNRVRLIRVRTKAGIEQGRTLSTGEWIDISLDKLDVMPW